MCLRIICSRAVRAVLFPFRVFGQEGFGLRGFCSWALAIRRAARRSCRVTLPVTLYKAVTNTSVRVCAALYAMRMPRAY